MAKLHKRPPESMVAQYGFFPSSTIQPVNPQNNRRGTWHPPNKTSSSYVTAALQADTRCSSSSVSRTMSYAQGRVSSVSNASQIACRPVTVLANPGSTGRTPVHTEYHNPYGSVSKSASAPRTDAERYWAYRAIVAETKLAERMGGRTDELGMMKDEIRNQSILDVAQKYHEERVQRLERLAVGLISTIVLITLILLFRHNASLEDKSSKRAFRPHLTIPILSPFTSIVEHEDSKFSFRTIAVFLIVLGVLAYAMFRHWLHQRPR